MSNLDEYRFDPNDDRNTAFPPLPRADRRPLLDPADWRKAEAACAAHLADAGMAIGMLAGLLGALDEAALRKATLLRLALSESEAMLWAAGTPLPQDVLIRDLSDAPASINLEALRLGRWAVRRLQGQGRLDDLRDFLGLRRAAQPVQGAAGLLRSTGDAFDEAGEAFHSALGRLHGCHTVTRAAYGHRFWRLTDLSPDGQTPEPACWSARHMATGTAHLAMVPMGHAGRRVWASGGDPAAYLTAWCRAVADGCHEAFHHGRQVSAWAARAGRLSARAKGNTAAKVIEALVGHPILSAAALERITGMSRDTAERQLSRLQGLGLVREVTGGRRYRLWSAQI